MPAKKKPSRSSRTKPKKWSVEPRKLAKVTGGAKPPSAPGAGKIAFN